MDYSKFVFAVQADDQDGINHMVPIITAVLIKFLKVRLGANHHDAEDCSQSTLLLATEQIRKDKIKNPDSVIYYLFTTAKNEYIKMMKSIREASFEEIPDSYKDDPKQLSALLSKERQSILKMCMELLKPDYLEYIKHWFNNPGDEAAVVANHFGISVNNAWTKKHRILKILRECCQKKLAL